MADYPLEGGYSSLDKGNTLMDNQIPMASFARFYEATGPQKVRIVRDARMYLSDPMGDAGRDYNWDFRNTLKWTHWQTDGISFFEAALAPLINCQSNDSKKEHCDLWGLAKL